MLPKRHIMVSNSLAMTCLRCAALGGHEGMGNRADNIVHGRLSSDSPALKSRSNCYTEHTPHATHPTYRSSIVPLQHPPSPTPTCYVYPFSEYPVLLSLSGLLFLPLTHNWTSVDRLCSRRTPSCSSATHGFFRSV